MNREEQILAAAREFACNRYKNCHDIALAIRGFLEGAQWADNNPKETTQIDWEQRRYEIAKDILAERIGRGKIKMPFEVAIKRSYELKRDIQDCIDCADVLIEKLKGIDDTIMPQFR